MSDMSNVKPEPASEPNSAASVANAFLLRSEREQSPISPMKMQKLIYLAHGYFLAEQDKPMIAEKFEAWRFGPVGLPQ